MNLYRQELQRYREAIQELILSGYEEGLDVATLADKLSVTPKTVYFHLKAMGLVMTPRSRDPKTGRFTKKQDQKDVFMR